MSNVIGLQLNRDAAWEAKRLGATKERRRYTHEVFVGCDFLNDAGVLVMQSMSSCGNPHNAKRKP